MLLTQIFLSVVVFAVMFHENFCDWLKGKEIDNE